jgi:Zn-dependent protease
MMTADPLQRELDSLKKQLAGLEKNLARLKVFHEKGCPVGRSLSDAVAELVDLRERINHARQMRMGTNGVQEEALNAVIAKHKGLFEQCEMIADGIEPGGTILASASMLPEFFARLVVRNRRFWLCWEYAATVCGVAMIAFACLTMTCFAAVGGIPFLKAYSLVGLNGVAFICGIILGLCLHEFSHSIALANNGIKIKRVGAMAGSFVGGFVEAEEDSFMRADPHVHMRFNACGIGANALTAMPLIFLASAINSEFLLFLAIGNLFFGMINSFPITPMDGGWVYEDLIRLHVNNEKTRRFLLSARFSLLIIWLALFTHAILAYRSQGV